MVSEHEIIDVRLTRTDLPEQNLSATYARMRAEREREAADEVARGNEAAQRVRAAADAHRDAGRGLTGLDAQQLEQDDVLLERVASTIGGENAELAAAELARDVDLLIVAAAGGAGRLGSNG